MFKTKRYEIEEAYVRGYRQAEEDLIEAAKAIELVQSRPEFHLAIALNNFVADIAREQGQKYNAKI